MKNKADKFKNAVELRKHYLELGYLEILPTDSSIDCPKCRQGNTSSWMEEESKDGYVAEVGECYTPECESKFFYIWPPNEE